MEIINYAAIIVCFKEHPTTCSHESQLPLNWTDNMTSKSWIRKAASKTKKGKALQNLLCSLMMNNPVGIKAEHIAGELNILADTISRTYSSSYSKELLSAIYLGLLEGQDKGLCLPKALGHFSQDKNTLYIFII